MGHLQPNLEGFFTSNFGHLKEVYSLIKKNLAVNSTTNWNFEQIFQGKVCFYTAEFKIELQKMVKITEKSV